MSSSLDEKTVRHVAHLARLKVSDEEVALFASQLSAVLRHMDQLNELDTTGTEPTVHPLPLSNVLREDEPSPTLTQADALLNAPQTQDSFFSVPKVLDQDSA